MMPKKGVSYFDFAAYYNKILNNVPVGVEQTFVEVGSYYGFSIMHLAEESRKTNKNIKLHAVDLWGPTLQTDMPHDGDAVYRDFLENIEEYKDLITPHRGYSWDMAVDFEDRSLDFVFIDADHTFDSVTKDLNAWTRKVKIGSIISGHDWHHQPVRDAVFNFFGPINIVPEHNCWEVKVSY
jgi:cephalosporin hydroxylase